MSGVDAFPLAGVLYGEGASCDALLDRVADGLARRGIPLAGVVQINDRYDALCACDMTLRDLSSGVSIRISQRLGRYARGCRLDPQAMAEAVSRAEAGLRQGAQCLILNKFGKAEAAGHGFRPLIAEAVERGVPVLVGVSATNLAAWRDFSGDAGTMVAASETAVVAWLASVLPQAAARIA